MENPGSRGDDDRLRERGTMSRAKLDQTVSQSETEEGLMQEQRKLDWPLNRALKQV
jgi:hypothetical protein